jgi:hypothetical protein
MGGSGGDDYSPGSDPTEVDCTRLRFGTYLTSVSAEVLATVNIRDVADVVLVSDRSFKAIEVWTRQDGSVLGAIVEQWSDLARCLRAGVPFVADILTVTPPVRIEVRPRPTLDCTTLTARTLLHLSEPIPAPQIGTVFWLTVDRSHRLGEQVRVSPRTNGPEIGWLRCHAVDLPECLEAGRRFQASVETVMDEQVFVHVEPARDSG